MVLALTLALAAMFLSACPAQALKYSLHTEQGYVEGEDANFDHTLKTYSGVGTRYRLRLNGEEQWATVTSAAIGIKKASDINSQSPTSRDEESLQRGVALMKEAFKMHHEQKQRRNTIHQTKRGQHINEVEFYTTAEILMYTPPQISLALRDPANLIHLYLTLDLQPWLQGSVASPPRPHSQPLPKPGSVMGELKQTLHKRNSLKTNPQKMS